MCDAHLWHFLWNGPTSDVEAWVAAGRKKPAVNFNGFNQLIKCPCTPLTPIYSGNGEPIAHRCDRCGKVYVVPEDPAVRKTCGNCHQSFEVSTPRQAANKRYCKPSCKAQAAGKARAKRESKNGKVQVVR